MEYKEREFKKNIEYCNNLDSNNDKMLLQEPMEKEESSNSCYNNKKKAKNTPQTYPSNNSYQICVLFLIIET